MKKLLLAVLLLLSSVANADLVRGEGPDFVDLTCTLPATRTDGSVLTIGEMSSVNWYVLTSASDVLTTPYYVDTGLACAATIYFSDFADGSYVIVATVKDTGGRESVASVGVPFVLATVAPPSPPTEMVMRRAGVVVH